MIKYIFYQIINGLLDGGFMTPLVSEQHTKDNDTYILGNRTSQIENCLHVGRFYALDGSLGASVHIDVSTPHVAVIAGKRGYGKSYTMGVFLEEFSRLPVQVRKRYSCIVIDTLGIFWTLNYPNEKQKDTLSQWGMKPEKTKIQILHTAKNNPFVYNDDQEVKQLQLPPQLLTINQWCELFQFSPVQPEAMVLSSSIISLQSRNNNFDLDNIKNELQTKTHAKRETIQTVENHLEQAQSWNLFSSKALPFSTLVKPGEITIIDLSYVQSTHLKQIITGIISKLLFYYRVDKRKTEEFYQITQKKNNEDTPYIWLAIDEAHLFLPQHESPYVKKVLLHNWLRQGRQPGLSVLLATQRPSFMDQEVISHSDLVFCHRLTAHEDIKSLTRLRPIYMKSDIESTIKQIGTEKGVALIIDDVIETTHILKIRPRYSWHGGSEPDVRTKIESGEEYGEKN